LAFWVIVALPAATCPPVGSAFGAGAAANTSDEIKLPAETESRPNVFLKVTAFPSRL